MFSWTQVMSLVPRPRGVGDMPRRQVYVVVRAAAN